MEDPSALINFFLLKAKQTLPLSAMSSYSAWWGWYTA